MHIDNICIQIYKNNYNRKQIESYLCACLGFEPSQLKHLNTMQLLDLIDNFQDVEDYLKEYENYK
mgnify:CR=1 FL=1